MQQSSALDIISLLPLFVLTIPFAIGFFLVAGRLGRSRALWTILSLIPLVNYFFFVYAAFVVVLNVLDRLPPIAPGVAQRSSR